MNHLNNNRGSALLMVLLLVVVFTVCRNRINVNEHFRCETI